MSDKNAQIDVTVVGDATWEPLKDLVRQVRETLDDAAAVGDGDTCVTMDAFFICLHVACQKRSVAIQERMGGNVDGALTREEESEKCLQSALNMLKKGKSHEG